MTRRGFLGFFVLGGLFGHLRKKLLRASSALPRKAMFWKSLD